VNGASVWSYDGTNFAQENALANEHDGSQPVTIGSMIYAAAAGFGAPNSKLQAFAPVEVSWSSSDSTKATIDPAANLAAIGRTDPGTVTLAATSVADNSISANFALTVIRKSQAINFAALADKTYGDSDFTVSATSVDSNNNATNLLVSFAVGATDNCTVTASTLSGGASTATVHITGAGSCTVTASQSGDDTTWSPAPSVSRTFTIARATATITVTPYSVTYDGNPHTATATVKGVFSEDLSGLDLSATTHTNAGDYPADPWTFTDVTGNYNNANGTTHDHIDKANAAIVVTPYSVTYDGNAHTATGSATGVKGEALAGLDLSKTTHTNAGDYLTDPWAFTDVTGN
jgi:hypothetical protein